MAHYLLPCECGRKLDITTAQAGERLPCACGRTVEAPTLRGFESLEQVAGPSAPVRKPWGARQGLAFLGASMIVAAVVGLGLLFLWRPPTLEQMVMEARRPELLDVDTITPAGAWLRWDMIRQGLIRPLSVPEVEAAKYGMSTIENWREWRLIACVGGGLGAVLVAASFLIPKRTRPRPVPPAARDRQRAP
jgi:hypothetical protein